MAVLKAEIVSRDTIKPYSPTPHHLRHFKLSLLDQLAPPFYIPILLFYSPSQATTLISQKLKASLSHVLTLYYPFCGTLIGNSIVDCNDEGVLYIDSRLPIELSNVIKNPQLYQINELLPFDPYNPRREETLGRNMAVQFNHFKCGGVALALCFSHKIADASTAASFLGVWAATSRKEENKGLVRPQMEEGALLFPPRNIEVDMTRGMVGDKDIVTKRFVFDASNISKLRQKLGCFNFNPTRVEAVTALIWKSSLEVAKATSAEGKFPVSPLIEMEEENMGLCDLAMSVRKTIRKVDGNYVAKLQRLEFFKVIESLKEARVMASKKGVPCYSFSSWVRFGFYEVNFGWGNPTYVRTIGVPIKNVVILMATMDGDGIEAWVTLTTSDMLQFEQNRELLEFASFDSY